MQTKIFKNEIPGIDVSFIEQDKYTFSVLTRILTKRCDFTLVKEKKLVICHSEKPYPVWIWTPDGIGEDEMEEAYILAKNTLSLSDNHFNMKYDLAAYFIKRAAQDGLNLKTLMNMLAYKCDAAVPPKKDALGYVEIATPDDLDEAVEFVCSFHNAVEIDGLDNETYRKKASEYISKGCFFFYNDGKERVACCTYNEMDDQCTVGSVFTKDDKRRMGYGAKLVYEISKRIISLGKTPELYTDGDYTASNSCYTGIGYMKVGSLCTIGIE